jgi:PAS domain S-box-containing protein
MDLAYPDDAAAVMSAWNTLVTGKSVTFEMRWKPRPGSGETAQWILVASVPVFDEDGKLVCIAGNTIDINAQKKSEEEAQARLAALEQVSLSERKFARFAQLAPMAIYIVEPGKGMQYVNDHFFELTGNPRVPFNELNWDDLLYEEDADKMRSDWSATIEGKKVENLQFRLKKKWTNQEGVLSNVWVQGSSYPELDEEGNVISIMGTLFDISDFKWAEDVQHRRVEEALEAKRQQEKSVCEFHVCLPSLLPNSFIDMTSHELRNPLSAVVQCADSVTSILQKLIPTHLERWQSSIARINEDISICIESLQTIVTCSLHQKRVIDDVLTLSKLDSSLLLITPIRVQPALVVLGVMKMFEVECNQMQIKFEFEEHESLQGFEWVMLDPSRVAQVLINLLYVSPTCPFFIRILNLQHQRNQIHQRLQGPQNHSYTWGIMGASIYRVAGCYIRSKRRRS